MITLSGFLPLLKSGETLYWHFCSKRPVSDYFYRTRGALNYLALFMIVELLILKYFTLDMRQFVI